MDGRLGAIVTTNESGFELMSKRPKAVENDYPEEHNVPLQPRDRSRVNVTAKDLCSHTTPLAARGTVHAVLRGPTKYSPLMHSSISPPVFLGPGKRHDGCLFLLELPRRFVEESLHQIWGILVKLVSWGPAGESHGNKFAETLISAMTSYPALFYAALSAETIHTSFLRRPHNLSRFELALQTETFHHLSHEMREPRRAILEPHLWAVLILGYSSRHAGLRAGKHPGQSCLQELQSIHVYCAMEMIPEHITGLLRLTEHLGGIKNIRTPGIGQTICFAGIIGASKMLQKPIFPFMAHTDTFISGERLSMADHVREWANLELLGSGFKSAWDPSTYSEVQKLNIVLENMCDLTCVVENHVQGRWMPTFHTVIIDQRNYVQHSLMSLKTKADLRLEGSQSDDLLYEPCRLASIAYSFLVVFPMPPVVGPFEALVEGLQVEIMAVGLIGHSEPRSRLLLWIVCLAAIAATGLPQRSWFQSQVKILSRHLNIRRWQQMKEILQTFLWLPSTNDPDGRDLWMEIQDDDNA